MPLPLPNLDDRKYADLVEEGRALIPTYAPAWTNHNPSDPGITLIELFAYLTDMLIYRLNRVTDANVLAFLRLLNGPEWQPTAGKSLNEEIRETVLTFRQIDRAITCADMERLTLAADPRIARAHCEPRRNLEHEDGVARQVDRPGHVSVIIVTYDATLHPSTELLEKVRAYLEPRRLLTTRVHVVGPRYVAVGVRLTLALKPGAQEDKFRLSLDLKFQSDLESNVFSTALRAELARNRILLSPQVAITIERPGSRWLISDQESGQTYTVRKEKKQGQSQNGATTAAGERLNLYEDTIRPQVIGTLRRYFHPVTGGADGQGWPWGRDVYISEIYALLDTQPGVDYVEKSVDANGQLLAELTTADAQRLLFHAGELVGVALYADELVALPLAGIDFTLKTSQRLTAPNESVALL